MGTAMILVLLHHTAAKRYLDAYEEAHGSRDPGAGWVLHADPVAAVEALRRRGSCSSCPRASSCDRDRPPRFVQ